jgi:predicted S18 family serine protease
MACLLQFSDNMKKIIAILICLLIFFLVYTLIYNLMISTETKIERKSYTEEFAFEPEQIVYINDTSITTIRVPAVDKNGNGVMATLSVDAKPGMGRTLVDINQILFWVDTQDSIRTAKIVAQNVTGIDLSNYDIIYSIQANASAIEGPSAGAGMAIATILELENRTIDEDVTITGTLNENGDIGKVSGVVAKAEATEAAGMNLLVVPTGQKTYTVYTEEKNCEDYLITKICRSVTKPEDVDVEEKVDIRVEEAGNIQEALKYFLI